MNLKHFIASGLTLFLFSFLLSFSSVPNKIIKTQSTLADTVSLTVAAGGVKVYKLDTIGLGKTITIQTNGLAGSAVVATKVDGYYNLRYEGLAPGDDCCYSVRLLGNNGFRETFFRFTTTNSVQDTIKRPVFVGTKDTVEIYLSQVVPASIENTCETSGTQYVDWQLVSGYTNPLKIEFSGLAHGVEQHCFRICNANQSVCETVTARITAFDKQLVNMPETDSLNTFCGQTTKLCLPFNTTALTVSPNYQLYLNRQAYSGNIGGCDFVPSAVSFNLFVLPGFGNAGPYFLERWTVNDTDFSGNFSNVTELVQMMNQWNPGGSWQSPPGVPIISGFYSADTIGNLRVIYQPTGALTIVSPNVINVPRGTELEVPAGTYPIELNYPFIGYADTLSLEVTCSDRTTFFNIKDTIFIGETAERVLDLSGLARPYQNIVKTYLDGQAADEASVTFVESQGKITYTGFSEGQEDVWLQVCGSLNMCDTFLIEITVKDANDGEITITNPPSPASVVAACNNVPPAPSVTAVTTCAANAQVQMNFDEQRTDGNCPFNYTLRRIWTFTDDCGNQRTATQMVTVEDKTAPTFMNFPADITLECGTPEPTDEPVVSDNCDNNTQVTFQRTQQNGSNPGNFTVRRQWTATDACGNRFTRAQTITFEDKTPPAFQNIPRDTTLNCSQTVPVRSPMATDACDPTPVITVQNSETPGTCPTIKIIRRTWTATDDTGNKSTVTQTITVNDVAPFLGNLTDTLSIDCANNNSPNSIFITPTYGDICDDRNDLMLTFTDQNFPNGCLTKENITRVWTVTDACGQTATRSQVIKYVDNQPPAFVNAPAQSVTVDTRIGEEIPPFQIPMATDACSGANVSATADTSLQANNIIIENEFFATDGCGNSTTLNQTITVITDPVWPGDADDDGLASGKDIFNLGFAFGESGNERMQASTTWTAQAALNWQGSTVAGVNFKHSDTDGNGQVETADTSAIKDNWGLMHQRPFNTMQFVTVPFYLELNNFTNDGWASFDVILGDASVPLDDFYGLAFTLSYDNSIVQDGSAYMVYEDSWAGNIADLLSIQKDFYTEGNLQTAVVRTTKTGTDGFGKIGTLFLKIKTPLPGMPVSLILSTQDGVGVFADQTEFELEDFQKNFDFVSGTKDKTDWTNAISLFPNPAKSVAYLEINEAIELQEIQLLDSRGRILWKSTERKNEIPLNNYAAGFYTLKIKTDRGIAIKKLSIEK